MSRSGDTQIIGHNVNVVYSRKSCQSHSEDPCLLHQKTLKRFVLYQRNSLISFHWNFKVISGEIKGKELVKMNQKAFDDYNETALESCPWCGRWELNGKIPQTFLRPTDDIITGKMTHTSQTRHAGCIFCEGLFNLHICSVTLMCLDISIHVSVEMGIYLRDSDSTRSATHLLALSMG